MNDSEVKIMNTFFDYLDYMENSHFAEGCTGHEYPPTVEKINIAVATLLTINKIMEDKKNETV